MKGIIRHDDADFGWYWHIEEDGHLLGWGGVTADCYRRDGASGWTPFRRYARWRIRRGMRRIKRNRSRGLEVVE